jgi:hypothetical protein
VNAPRCSLPYDVVYDNDGKPIVHEELDAPSEVTDGVEGSPQVRDRS